MKRQICWDGEDSSGCPRLRVGRGNDWKQHEDSEEGHGTVLQLAYGDDDTTE